MSSTDRHAVLPLMLGAAILVAPACAAAPARAGKAADRAAPTCAATRGGVALSRVSVFDGPPEAKADLVPDGETEAHGATVSRWNVASVYRAGRVVHAVCRYGEAEPLVVALTRPVGACRLVDTGGARTLACR